MLMCLGHKTQKRHLALTTENNHFTHRSKQKHINMWVTILLKPKRQKLSLLQYITHSNNQCTTAQPTFFMKTFSLVEYHQFIVFFTFRQNSFTLLYMTEVFFQPQQWRYEGIVCLKGKRTQSGSRHFSRRRNLHCLVVFLFKTLCVFCYRKRLFAI